MSWEGGRDRHVGWKLLALKGQGCGQEPHRCRKAGVEVGATGGEQGCRPVTHRGLCLPGLVAACPGDPESADEAQPPAVLCAVALLRPGL